jgi:hypothetical protein
MTTRWTAARRHPALRLRKTRLLGEWPHGLAGRPRLLVNFLEHEMGIAGLFSHDRIPGNVVRRLLDLTALEIRERHAGPLDDGHLAIVEEHDVARMAENGRDIGRHEEFILAEPDDDRRAIPDGNDRVRIFRGNHNQREQSAD